MIEEIKTFNTRQREDERARLLQWGGAFKVVKNMWRSYVCVKGQVQPTRSVYEI